MFIQTTGGVAYKGPSPSPELLIELGKDFPNFGYVKEEAGNVIARMRAERERRPIEDVLKARTSGIPAGRAGDPREFAAVVAFLASGRATFLTGTAIQVDGGQVPTLI